MTCRSITRPPVTTTHVLGGFHRLSKEESNRILAHLCALRRGQRVKRRFLLLVGTLESKLAVYAFALQPPGDVAVERRVAGPQHGRRVTLNQFLKDARMVDVIEIQHGR